MKRTMPRNVSSLFCWLSFVWCSFFIAVPFAASHSHPFYHNDRHHGQAAGGNSTMGCGTESPSLESLARDQIRLKHFHRSEREQRQDPGKRKTRRAQFASCNDLELHSIEIKTYFHFMAVSVSGDPSGNTDGYVIPHPTDVALSNGALGDYTTYDEMVIMCQRQVEILNDAFRDTPFYYTFQSNPSVSTNIDFTNYPMDNMQDMRERYGVADPKALNVYLSFSLGSLTSDTTGFIGRADFPFFQLTGDGLFMRYDVLPGGGLPDNDDGYIAVHEIGHWHGLLHPFSNLLNSADACDSTNENDFVQDTPAMKAATLQLNPEATCSEFENGKRPDSCPDRDGVDPVYNFMNYVRDRSCMNKIGEFTCGQIERMYQHWILYRDQVKGCESNEEMEIEIFILFDKFHALDYSFFLQNTATKEKLFDSEEDFLNIESSFNQDSLLVDICVPKDAYRFVFKDTRGDGFSCNGSYFEVRLDGKSLAKVSGNFGSQKNVEISPPTTSTAEPKLVSLPDVLTDTPTMAPSTSPVIPRPTVKPVAPTHDPTLEPTNNPRSASAPTPELTRSPIVSPTVPPFAEPTDNPPSSSAQTEKSSTAPAFPMKPPTLAAAVARTNSTAPTRPTLRPVPNGVPAINALAPVERFIVGSASPPNRNEVGISPTVKEESISTSAMTARETSLAVGFLSMLFLIW